MTEFLRNGFYRRSALGNIYWVNGHDVNREIWNRRASNQEQVAYFREQLWNVRVGQTATSRYVIPNAECPVCKRQVFFYQNRYGGRVYFDELGPPWPKHPCTDNNQPVVKPDMADSTAISPASRSSDEVAHVDSWLRLARQDPSAGFGEKYDKGQWSAWELKGDFRSRSSALLVLTGIDSATSRRLYLYFKNAPKSLTVGTLVFTYSGWISYFEPESMKVIESEVLRIKGASALVDALLAGQRRRQRRG